MSLSPPGSDCSPSSSSSSEPVTVPVTEGLIDSGALVYAADELRTARSFGDCSPCSLISVMPPPYPQTTARDSVPEVGGLEPSRIGPQLAGSSRTWAVDEHERLVGDLEGEPDVLLDQDDDRPGLVGDALAPSAAAARR